MLPKTILALARRNAERISPCRSVNLFLATSTTYKMPDSTWPIELRLELAAAQKRVFKLLYSWTNKCSMCLRNTGEFKYE